MIQKSTVLLYVPEMPEMPAGRTTGPDPIRSTARSVCRSTAVAIWVHRYCDAVVPRLSSWPIDRLSLLRATLLEAYVTVPDTSCAPARAQAVPRPSATTHAATVSVCARPIDCVAYVVYSLSHQLCTDYSSSGAAGAQCRQQSRRSSRLHARSLLSRLSTRQTTRKMKLRAVTIRGIMKVQPCQRGKSLGEAS
eukprot:COSAG05_NODE_65_length_22456_cov_17.448540_14_plen_193_part_00